MRRNRIDYQQDDVKRRYEDKAPAIYLERRRLKNYLFYGDTSSALYHQTFGNSSFHYRIQDGLNRGDQNIDQQCLEASKGQSALLNFTESITRRFNNDSENKPKKYPVGEQGKTLVLSFQHSLSKPKERDGVASDSSTCSIL
ncbi:uncharacterized protein LOC111695641 [Eurytemora carolleeae]|uniref:uncharacterized protein LOC111695641 n=1 Tax=Eurytemora carolleeae TaxID=1294199 RepID=UPI000C758AEE|nr:uncharacterized protein LOC111695641 [Eurytemora carolleeae]XP_023320809.1 uncharacterized protein LOC111695641 [Eurytemora carolleeae]XP_023320818.1 uncharacterized protein LOC111695641 [Eurytemora carolleeae]XP_023320827.1 uncharacterized protein LOC111695641 [Eurytemora carolleeae]|eukprot:XP_023320801.1 uncharacterized protein LOC111695641 [Eurytemora affinis]